MEYNLLPAQTEFLNIPHDYTLDVALYQGGYGSGKTFSGALLGILLAMKYPGITGLVGADTFPLVRDTTLVTYFEHLDNMGFIQGRDYDFKAAEAKIIFQNGSQILFRHFQEPHKLKSLNLGFVEIEEMSDCAESTFLMLLSRLRQRIKPEWKGFKYRLFGHTNPEASKGWIYTHFVEKKKPNYRLILAPTTQNTYLSKHYVESLKEAYDPEYYRMNVLGEFGDYTSGLVVKSFTSDNIKPVTYLPDLPLHISTDFNVDPMCWLLCYVVSNKVFYFDEIVIENTHTKQTTEEFIRRYGNHKGGIIINGDASGDYRKTQSEMSDYVIMRETLRKHFGKAPKIEIRGFNPPIHNRVAAFNRMVCDAKGNRRIIVDPKCERFLYNIHNLKYKTGTSIIDVPSHTQIKNDNKLKFLEHPFDAGSYIVEYYFPINKDLGGNR